MATPYPRYGVDARKDMGNEYPICALRPVLSLRSFEGFCVSISAGPERYASGFLWPAFCASFFEYPAIRSQTRRPHRNCSQSCVACTNSRLQGNPVQRQSVSACTHLALVSRHPEAIFADRQSFDTGSWCDVGPAGHCRRGRVATTGLLRRAFGRGERVCWNGGRLPVLGTSHWRSSQRKRAPLRANPCLQVHGHGSFFDTAGFGPIMVLQSEQPWFSFRIVMTYPKRAVKGAALVMPGPSRSGQKCRA